MIFGFEKARAIPDATPAPATTLFNSPISLASESGLLILAALPDDARSVVKWL
ncbi:hypothetical protein [Flavisphingomonas formosensis]|uniref:hypothetical protein n=1 Tax=Flavisphingomonas formosensis TaxID=861534 RepID=UPI0012FBD280|nr:hypothetical protein [Sphingomonas formosensis]